MRSRQDIERHFKLLEQGYKKIKPKLGFDSAAESDAFSAMLKQRNPNKINEMHEALFKLIKKIPLYNQANNAIRAHFWAQIGPLDVKWQALFRGNDADMQLYQNLVSGQKIILGLVEGYCRLAANYQTASSVRSKSDIEINLLGKKRQIETLIEEYNEEHKKIIQRVQEIEKIKASVKKKYSPMESIERAVEVAAIMLSDKLGFDQRYGKESAIELNSVLAKFNKNKSADNAVETIEQVKKMLEQYITYLQGKVAANDAHKMTNPRAKLQFLESCRNKLEAGKYDQQMHLLFINLREMDNELSKPQVSSASKSYTVNNSDARIVSELGGPAPKPVARPANMSKQAASEKLKTIQGNEPLKKGLLGYLEQSRACYSLARDILGANNPAIQEHSRCHLDVEKYISDHVNEKGMSNKHGPEMVSKLEANQKAMKSALLAAGDKVFLQLDSMAKEEAKHQSQEFLMLDTARRELAIKMKNAKENGNAANIKALVDAMHKIQGQHFPKPEPPPAFNPRLG